MKRKIRKGRITMGKVKKSLALLLMLALAASLLLMLLNLLQ